MIISEKINIRDEFLSEEDLGIADMSNEELEAYWNFWLEQAQITNDEDKYSYSHGVFTIDPMEKYESKFR